MDPDPRTEEISKEQVERDVISYLLREFLSDEDPTALTGGTQLISSGVLDSISVVRLVDYLEENYRMKFEAHEISVDCLDTPAQIAETVLGKLS